MKLFEIAKKKYTPEEIIDAVTRMYKETGDLRSGGECGDMAYIYHYLNPAFKYVGNVYVDEPDDESFSHVAVEYKGKYYDGRGEHLPHDKNEIYVPAVFIPGTSFWDTSFKSKDGRYAEAIGVIGGGRGEPESDTYHELLTYLRATK